MAERLVRFGLGDGAARRAATWRCWTNARAGKSDVYLTCRELRGSLKATAHDSGEWHVAFSAEFAEEHFVVEAPEPKSRFLDVWPRPAAFAPGMTLAFRILTPWVTVNVPLEPHALEGVVWIPVPNEGEAAESSIILVGPNTQVDAWPGHDVGTQLVGTFTTLAGESVWVVWRTVTAPEVKPGGPGRVHFFKGRDKDDLRGPHVRAIAFADHPTGARVLIESIVRPS